MKNILYLIILLFSIPSLVANDNRIEIKNALLNLSSLKKDSTIIWEFKSKDKINFVIINSEAIKNKITYLIHLQLLTDSKSKELKAFEGKVKLLFNQETKQIISHQLIEFNLKSLSSEQFNDIIESQKLWKNFTEDFKKNKREIIVNYFDYPIQSLHSTIQTKEILLNRYDVYFKLLKNHSNLNSLLSFLHIKNSSNSNKNDCIIEVIQINEFDEENPMEKLTIKAKKIGKKFLFYSIDLNS